MVGVELEGLVVKHLRAGNVSVSTRPHLPLNLAPFACILGSLLPFYLRAVNVVAHALEERAVIAQRVDVERVHALGLLDALGLDHLHGPLVHELGSAVVVLRVQQVPVVVQ